MVNQIYKLYNSEIYGSPFRQNGCPKTSEFYSDFGKRRDLIAKLSKECTDIVNPKKAL